MLAIRPAQADDLQAVHLVLKDCGLPYEDITTSHLSDFLVLANGKPVVGCVGIERLGSDALLRSLAVFDFMRGSGWGQQLVHAAEAHAQNIDISALYLLTTTATTFFGDRGYRRIDRADAPAALQGTTQFSLLCPASSTCLFKSLPLTI